MGSREQSRLYHICHDAPLYGCDADIFWRIKLRLQEKTPQISRMNLDSAIYLADRELDTFFCQSGGCSSTLDSVRGHRQYAESDRW